MNTNDSLAKWNNSTDNSWPNQERRAPINYLMHFSGEISLISLKKLAHIFCKTVSFGSLFHILLPKPN